MQVIVITSKQLRREAWILLGCFLAACAVNAGAILAYDRPWSELFTQIGYVIVLALALWILLLALRLLVFLLRALLRSIAGKRKRDTDQ